MIGRVKFFNSKKGYGFIECGDSDMFFHVSEVENRENLESEQIVSFDIGTNKKNGLPEAKNVCKN